MTMTSTESDTGWPDIPTVACTASVRAWTITHEATAREVRCGDHAASTVAVTLAVVQHANNRRFHAGGMEYVVPRLANTSPACPFLACEKAVAQTAWNLEFVFLRGRTKQLHLKRKLAYVTRL